MWVLNCVVWVVTCVVCVVSCVVWVVTCVLWSCELCYVSCELCSMSRELCSVSCGAVFWGNLNAFSNSIRTPGSRDALSTVSRVRLTKQLPGMMGGGGKEWSMLEREVCWTDAICLQSCAKGRAGGLRSWVLNLRAGSSPWGSLLILLGLECWPCLPAGLSWGSRVDMLCELERRFPRTWCHYGTLAVLCGWLEDLGGLCFLMKVRSSRKEGVERLGPQRTRRIQSPRAQGPAPLCSFHWIFSLKTRISRQTLGNLRSLHLY